MAFPITVELYKQGFIEEGHIYRQARKALPKEYDGLSFAQMELADANREMFWRFACGCSRVARDACKAFEIRKEGEFVVYLRNLDLYGICAPTRLHKLRASLYDPVDVNGDQAPSPLTKLIYHVHHISDISQLVIRNCGSTYVSRILDVIRLRFGYRICSVLVDDDITEISVDTGFCDYARRKTLYNEILAQAARDDPEASRAMREPKLIDGNYWMSMLELRMAQ